MSITLGLKLLASLEKSQPLGSGGAAYTRAGRGITRTRQVESVNAAVEWIGKLRDRQSDNQLFAKYRLETAAASLLTTCVEVRSIVLDMMDWWPRDHRPTLEGLVQLRELLDCAIHDAGDAHVEVVRKKRR